MVGGDDTFQAAAAILKDLAREVPPSDDSKPSPEIAQTNGVDAKKVKLPGAATPGKVAFESELRALVCRVHDLEVELVSDPYRTSIPLNPPSFPSLCALIPF